LKLLVVEDDKDLNGTIVKYLKLKEFSVDSALDGEEALNLVYENSYDLIVLDVKLPKIDGFEVAKAIREFSDVPIIFLTSLDSQKDIQKGFLSGGDDYITKPFSLNELLLRVKAVLKRVYKNQEVIKIADNIEFFIDKELLYKDGEIIHLTPKETRLLKLFLQNPNKILSKDEITNKIYDYNEELSEGTLRVFITNLRKIIGKDKIQTVKNLGYFYVE